uniref:Uncharacterized protein n=1 Tax=Opuntia streptacantha TaxID=393608 RepID=A0A7C9E726_OPUST
MMCLVFTSDLAIPIQESRSCTSKLRTTDLSTQQTKAISLTVNLSRSHVFLVKTMLFLLDKSLPSVVIHILLEEPQITMVVKTSLSSIGMTDQEDSPVELQRLGHLVMIT